MFHIMKEGYTKLPDQRLRLKNGFKIPPPTSLELICNNIIPEDDSQVNCE